jgi:hypothetical protein
VARHGVHQVPPAGHDPGLGPTHQLVAAEQHQIDPGLQASIVKDLGCQFEQRLPGLAQELVGLEPTLADAGTDYQQVLGNLMQLAPSFSLRGGTLEILRGIIARGLGVR